MDDKKITALLILMLILLGLFVFGCVMDEEGDPAGEAGRAQQGGGHPELNLTVMPMDSTPVCFQGKDCPK